jgi:hypothetical protein
MPSELVQGGSLDPGGRTATVRAHSGIFGIVVIWLL